MVTVLPNWTWSACVQNKIVDTRGCSRLNSFAETINNVSELIQLLSAIDGSKHCAGNPDEKFNDLVASHKGIFKNQQGYHYLYIVFIYSCVLAIGGFINVPAADSRLILRGEISTGNKLAKFFEGIFPNLLYGIHKHMHI